jgi:RNA polymerase sigma factor (sigma-70 family)
MAELYDRHHSAALRIAAAYATHEYLAEDLVADAFTALLRALAAGGGPKSAVRGYLAVSMRNAAASHGRRRKHPASPRLADDELLHAVPDSGPALDDGLLREHTRRDLAAAFGKLHPSWQQVLVLTAVEGLGVGEAGARLGLTPPAARALAYRARRAFQDAYAAGESSQTAARARRRETVGAA